MYTWAYMKDTGGVVAINVGDDFLMDLADNTASSMILFQAELNTDNVEEKI